MSTHPKGPVRGELGSLLLGDVVKKIHRLGLGYQSDASNGHIDFRRIRRIGRKINLKQRGKLFEFGLPLVRQIYSASIRTFGRLTNLKIQPRNFLEKIVRVDDISLNLVFLIRLGDSQTLIRKVDPVRQVLRGHQRSAPGRQVRWIRSQARESIEKSVQRRAQTGGNGGIGIRVNFVTKNEFEITQDFLLDLKKIGVGSMTHHLGVEKGIAQGLHLQDLHSGPLRTVLCLVNVAVPKLDPLPSVLGIINVGEVAPCDLNSHLMRHECLAGLNEISEKSAHKNRE